MSTLASIAGKGVVGSRPSFGIAGQTYFATDVLGGTLQRDTGSAWENLVSGSMVQIDKQTLGSSIAYTSPTIPGGYSHLRLVGQVRGSAASLFVQAGMRFNGDSGTNYTYEAMFVQNAGNANTGAAAATSMYIGSLTADTATAGYASSFDILIPNYAGTTFMKSVISTTQAIATNALANTSTMTSGGLWLSTAAITSIVTIDSYKTGSVFTLYGIV